MKVRAATKLERPARATRTVTLSVAAALMIVAASTYAPEEVEEAGTRTLPTLENDYMEDGAEYNVLSIVGARGGAVGARILLEDQVEVGDSIVAVEGGPATLERFEAALAELARSFHEEHEEQGWEKLKLRVTLEGGQERTLSVTGTSRVRKGEAWTYSATTGALVAEGREAARRNEVDTPEEDQEPPDAARAAKDENDSPRCREIADRFGPRPEGAPCWWLTRAEEQQISEERRQRAIASPDTALPWQREWAFHPGEEGKVPAHRIPEGRGYEQAAPWVTAGAYSTSQVTLRCHPGSTSRLTGSVRTGSWAAHAVACMSAEGQQTSGSFIYAQPDPTICILWLIDSCGTGRITLMSMVGPSEGMRPDIEGYSEHSGDIDITSLGGGLTLRLPASPSNVPYMYTKEGGEAA